MFQIKPGLGLAIIGPGPSDNLLVREDFMARLDLNSAYLERLSLKVRAVMGKVPGIGDYGSNPTDEDIGNVLEELPGDLSREEVIEEIQGLSPRKQAELVALMWLGRGDGDLEDWDQLVTQAGERRETPTWDYLLGEPLVADYWTEGLEKLGARVGVDGVERI